uniref:Uncharacterized protein n=1 Tax=Candidatus Kentrum sp. TUN TaxID=2126343 RepID=A0A451A3U9_9GAMM|nr:MAG: hypothetical protein BECKTUN1418D_GA0071000_11331 [Candidatus Kentron sp. TUN]
MMFGITGIVKPIFQQVFTHKKGIYSGQTTSNQSVTPFVQIFIKEGNRGTKVITSIPRVVFIILLTIFYRWWKFCIIFNHDDAWPNATDGGKNMVIVSVQGHPFLRAVILRVLENIETYDPYRQEAGRWGGILLTGPAAYTLSILPIQDLEAVWLKHLDGKNQ